jgi:hypothetical protein
VKKSIILVLVCSLASCGQNETAKPSERSVTPTATAPSKGAANTATFPDYAPQYPDSTIIETTPKSFDDFSSTEIVMTTDDPVAKVSEFYRASLSKSVNMPITYDESTPEKLDIMAGDFVGGVAGKTETNLGTSLSAKIVDGKTHIFVLFNRPLK